MRLRNPGGAEKALETVRKVRNELGNADGRKDAFLSWCDHWASPQLGNHFQATDELFAEIAECYHRLVMLAGMPEGQLNGLMQRECRAWDGRLERLEADLAELIRFLGRPGRVVALDTSALMEGVFFTEFDWHGLDGSLREQPIRLVVLSLVTEELDELKRHRDGRRRAQARKVLTTLWDLHRARPASPAALPKYADVTIEVLLDGGWHQRMPNNDGEIIDQAVGLKEQTGQEVILAAETTRSYTGPRRPG